MEAKDILLTMEKEGVFVLDGNYSIYNQCVEEGARVYDYKVTIVCTADQINDDAWIIEVSRIDDLVQQQAERNSCERMAMDLCAAVKEFLEEHDVKAQKISVCIIGGKGGKMTACWEDKEKNAKRVVLTLE